MSVSELKNQVITIDGPSGTGKGTIARRLGHWLGWHLLDSGALYRIVAHLAESQQVPLDAVDALSAIAANLQVDFQQQPEETLIIINNQDVTLSIRSEARGAQASQVAAYPAVREALLERQRGFLRAPGLVADGRDMGTVVFPTAGLKIFLTASAEERAERRYKQLKQKGMSVNLAQLLDDISARDKRDQERAASPLKPAQDAITVDTTGLDIAAVDAQVKQLVVARGLA